MWIYKIKLIIQDLLIIIEQFIKMEYNFNEIINYLSVIIDGKVSLEY